MSGMNTRDFLVTTGKASLEVQFAEDDEFVPTLVVEREDGTYDLMVMIGAHPFDMMMSIVPTLREMDPPVASLGLTVDSYMMLSGDHPAEMLALRATYGGSLAAMHADGVPGVSECLSIHIVTPLNMEIIQLPYVRHNTGLCGIEWLPEYLPPDDVVHGGRLIKAMQAVWL